VSLTRAFGPGRTDSPGRPSDPNRAKPRRCARGRDRSGVFGCNGSRGDAELLARIGSGEETPQRALHDRHVGWLLAAAVPVPRRRRRLRSPAEHLRRCLAERWTRDARDVPVTSMSSSTTAAPHRAMGIQLLAGLTHLDPAIRRAVEADIRLGISIGTAIAESSDLPAADTALSQRSTRTRSSAKASQRGSGTATSTSVDKRDCRVRFCDGAWRDGCDHAVTTVAEEGSASANRCSPPARHPRRGQHCEHWIAS